MLLKSGLSLVPQARQHTLRASGLALRQTFSSALAATKFTFSVLKRENSR